MKSQFGFKKHIRNGIISEKCCTFVQTNRNCSAQMRVLLLFLSYLVTAIISPVRGQTSAGSNIVSRTVLSGGGVAEQRVYDNGLGDVIQEVQSWPSTSLQDIVVHHEYDQYRRRAKSWLPVNSSTGSGYIPVGSISSTAVYQYADNAPYSRTVYDGFLQSQPASQYKAGAQWQNNGKKVSSFYFESVAAGMFSPEYGYLYTFPNVEYLCTQTFDEDGSPITEYTDLNGRLLISETVQGKTYYLYNPKGDLTYVIPPALTAYIFSEYGYDSGEIPDTDEMMQKYAYVYRYDDQRHCIYKKLPGIDPVYYVYDRTGACILSQDGSQRLRNEWAYTIPDKFGRPCLSGICNVGLSYVTEPLHSVHVYAEYDGTTVATGGYTVHNLSLSVHTLYSAAYYDSYSFIGHHGVPSSLTASSVSGFSVDASLGRGLQTGSATAIIARGIVTGYMYTALYYDSRYNVSQVKSTNHLGGTDLTCTLSTYTGKPANVYIQQTTSGAGTVEVSHSYSYDGADRMSSHTVSVTHGGPTASATLTYGYDNLGRPSRITRPLGSGTNQHVTYAYDLHGWPTGITSNSFSESLYYASGLGTPRYNGNISSICWQNSNYSIQRGYKFTYDAANRLTQGAYGEGSSLMSNTNKFRESVQYDAATGNITGITRNGATSSYDYGLIDDLTLSYDGYRLTGVSDTRPDTPYGGTYEYKKANGSQYIYDANGSLIADKSRGIAYIVYNSDNNPVRICFTNGNETKYVYSAGGQKLRVAHYVAKPNITRTFGQIPPELTSSQELYADSVDYMLGGSLLLKNGYVVDKYLFDGGYAQASGSITDSFSFYYYNKDHLGNNREVVDANGTVKQVVNYYPFGGLFGDPSSMYGSGIQLYKYNGKEFDNMHGLNTYDYGARQYDPILARWDRVDPLCEKYYSTSPYAYCENNPISSIDPDGRNGLKLLLKGAYKIGKTVAKNGLSSLTKSATYATAFNDVVDDAKTVLDFDAPALDRAVAGFSLLSEVVSPVSFREGKTAVNHVQELTSRAARRKVMRDQGIPTSQQPKSQSKNDSGREYTYETPGSYGTTETKSVQQQTKDRSHDEPHWEAGSVRMVNGKPKMNNYKRPRLENSKSKAEYE